LNIFLDKKQVPILGFQGKVLKINLSIDSELKLRQVLEGSGRQREGGLSPYSREWKMFCATPCILRRRS
jgi:hypothetical protein